MLTKSEITSASNQLDETDIALLLPLIRNTKRYRDNLPLFSDLESVIEDANGTVQAKQINAVLAKVIALGPGEVGINGGEDALNYSQAREREALVNYIISILYEVSELNILRFEVKGADTDYKIGQRNIIGDFL